MDERVNLLNYIDAPERIICANGTQWQTGDAFLGSTIKLFTVVKTYDGCILGYLARDKADKAIGLIFLSGAIITEAKE